MDRSETKGDVDRIVRRQNRSFVSTRRPSDDLLQLVAVLGRAGPGVAIGLIVDGTIVTGAIGPTQSFVDVLRDATADALGPSFAADSALTEDLLSAYERWIDNSNARLESDREAAEAFLDAKSIDEIPVEKTIEYFSALQDQPYIELRDASIRSGAADPIEIKHLRLRVDSVSAWWPLKAQGVNVNYVWHSEDQDSD